MAPWYLYLITNVVNDKKYVGITNNPLKRRSRHFSGHGSRLIRAAIAKYGHDKLLFQILVCGHEHYIKQLETKVIHSFGTLTPDGYNLTRGGEGAGGRRASEDTRRKMSQWHRGKKLSAETRAKIGVASRLRLAKHNHLRNRRKATKSAPNPACKPITIDGHHFTSLRDAAKHAGLNYKTFTKRIRKYRETDSWPRGWSDGSAPAAAVLSHVVYSGVREKV